MDVERLFSLAARSCCQIFKPPTTKPQSTPLEIEFKISTNLYPITAKEAGVIVLTKSCCKSVLSKVFTGSVVSNVVHKSFRPVLVVP